MKFDEVYKYLDDNNDRFPADAYPTLLEKLSECDPDAFEEIKKKRLKNPTFYVVISIFLGYFGIDQLLLKNYSRGILKLLTQGGILCAWIYDIFHIREDVQMMNYETINSMATPDLETIIRHVKIK